MRSSKIWLRKLKLRLRDKGFANHKASCTTILQQPLQLILALWGCSATDLFYLYCWHGEFLFLSCSIELTMLASLCWNILISPLSLVSTLDLVEELPLTCCTVVKDFSFKIFSYSYNSYEIPFVLIFSCTSTAYLPNFLASDITNWGAFLQNLIDAKIYKLSHIRYPVIIDDPHHSMKQFLHNSIHLVCRECGIWLAL